MPTHDERPLGSRGEPREVVAAGSSGGVSRVEGATASQAAISAARMARRNSRLAARTGRLGRLAFANLKVLRRQPDWSGRTGSVVARPLSNRFRKSKGPRSLAAAAARRPQARFRSSVGAARPAAVELLQERRPNASPSCPAPGGVLTVEFKFVFM
jgi:hypothetical protein